MSKAVDIEGYMLRVHTRHYDKVNGVIVCYKGENDKMFFPLKARPHGKWIPCSERLPEERGYYLVTTDGSHNDVIDIAEYGIYKNLVWGWNKASKIIAWMPLPEPYQKEGEVE